MENRLSIHAHYSVERKCRIGAVQLFTANRLPDEDLDVVPSEIGSLKLGR